MFACLFACDELTASLWRVDCMSSRPGDELTCDELTVWRVDRVTSWPCDELTGSHAEGLWRMRRHGPVIAHCTDSENFPPELQVQNSPNCSTNSFSNPSTNPNPKRKVFRIGTVRYNWPMSAHASQAFSIAHCTDSEDFPPKPSLNILWIFTGNNLDSRYKDYSDNKYDV